MCCITEDNVLMRATMSSVYSVNISLKTFKSKLNEAGL